MVGGRGGRKEEEGEEGIRGSDGKGRRRKRSGGREGRREEVGVSSGRRNVAAAVSQSKGDSHNVMKQQQRQQFCEEGTRS